MSAVAVEKTVGVGNGPVHRSDSFKMIANFASIYLIWGSTYLAIKYAIAEFPPFLLSGGRFVLASLVLLLFARLSRESWPDRRTTLVAGVSGTLLVLGNSLVCVSEQWLSSGTVAVMIGTAPVWITILNSAFFGGSRPTLRQAAGIALALGGIFFLTRSQADTHGADARLGLTILSFSVIGWSFGTLIQRKARTAGAFFSFSGLQLLIGGTLMLGVSAFLEGPGAFRTLHITHVGWMSALYLVVFGSVIAYSSYLWLVQRVEPAKVSTYALVNPLIAVWLGWLLGGESFTLLMLAMSGVILLGLYFVVFERKRA